MGFTTTKLDLVLVLKFDCQLVQQKSQRLCFSSEKGRLKCRLQILHFNIISTIIGGSDSEPWTC